MSGSPGRQKEHEGDRRDLRKGLWGETAIAEARLSRRTAQAPAPDS